MQNDEQTKSHVRSGTERFGEWIFIVAFIGSAGSVFDQWRGLPRLGNTAYTLPIGLLLVVAGATLWWALRDETASREDVPPR